MGKGDKGYNIGTPEAGFFVSTLADATTMSLVISRDNQMVKIDEMAQAGTLNLIIGGDIEIGAKLLLRCISDGTGRDITLGTGTCESTIFGTANETKWAELYYDGSVFNLISVYQANITEFTKLTTLTADEIVGTTAGCIGHVDGAIIVAAPASGYVLQYKDALLIYDYDTAAYTGGGHNLYINIGSSGTQLHLTKNIASTLLLGATGDKIYGPYKEYSGGVGLPIPTGAALSLASTAWTQPGTAAGVLRCYVTYNLIATGL